MKKISIIACAFLISAPMIQGTSSAIELESEILKKFDGSPLGITSEVIARIKKYQRKILDLLRGAHDHVTAKRQGKYQFEGTVYSVQELAKIEEDIAIPTEKQRAQMLTALTTMRRDFETISLEFRPVIHGTKDIMSELIKDSCKKRNRVDSLLYVWAQTRAESEFELFDKNFTNIKNFEIFLVDLYNFLEDLVFNCPKAHKEFTDKLEKYKTEHAEKMKRVKEVIPQCANKPHNEAAFLNAIAPMLDKLALYDISVPRVTSLITSFNKNH